MGANYDSIWSNERTICKRWILYDSIFSLCNGNDMVELHKQRIKSNIPNEGSIRVLVITEKQYENVDILLGKKSFYEKPTQYENLTLF